MKILEYLPETQILLDIALADKESLLHFIADTCVKNGVISDGNTLFRGMMKREQTMSTGVGNGIGIPHTTSQEAKKAAVLLIRPSDPIDFQSLDEKPVDVVLALVIPEKDTTLHLRLLARITRLCRNKEFMDAVRKAHHPNELYQAIGKLEEKIMIHS